MCVGVFALSFCCLEACMVSFLLRGIRESCSDTTVTHHSFSSSPSALPNTMSTVFSNFKAFSSAPSHSDTPHIKSFDWVLAKRPVAVGGPTAGRGAAPQLWTAHPRGGPKISRSGPARE